VIESGASDLPPNSPALSPAPPPEPPTPAPIPVLPLEYAPPAPAGGRWWRRIAFICLAVAWPLCLIALGAILYETESVVITGPILFTLGVLALLGGLFTRHRLVVALGAAHCGICLLFLLLVNAMEWSPDEAHVPFLVMGTVYTLALAVPTAIALGQHRDGATGRMA
jgi:hypothetical protein